jgi:hypothetical protein
MTGSKTSRSQKTIKEALAPRAIGDGDPAVYSYEELRAIIAYAKKHHHGLVNGGKIVAAQDGAEAFRRRVEIIHIFRGLPERLRNRPTGQATKDGVLMRLERIGISCSERTLARDYDAVGGTKALRAAKPFAPGEDTSSPFLPGPGKPTAKLARQRRILCH